MLAYTGEAGRQEAFLLLALESDSLKCLSAISAWFRHLVHNFLSSVIVGIDTFGETTYDMILLSKCRFRSLQNLDLRIPMGYNTVFCGGQLMLAIVGVDNFPFRLLPKGK